MERFFDENLRNRQPVSVFFEQQREQTWNTFSPSVEERDLYEAPTVLYGTLNQTVFDMKLDF